MPQPLRVAVVGAGKMGRHHALAIGRLPETATLVGVADRSTEFATALGAELGVPAFTDVDALMREYRAYGTTHANRYLAMPVDALHHAEHAEAGDRLMGVFLAVLRAYDLDGSAAVHAIRSLRTVAHGFVTIEIAGGFGLPEKLDETFDRLIAMVIADLHRTGDST